MRFVLKLYWKQVAEGRVFLHEHPRHATSWMLDEVRQMMKREGITIVEADQCMFGLKTWGDNRSKLVPAKKPTRFMTNSRALGQEFNQRCDSSHEHQSLVDGRAASAARYPDELCKAICRGIIKEKMERRRGVRAVAEIDRRLLSRCGSPAFDNSRRRTDLE